MSNDNDIERVEDMAMECGMSVAPSGNGYWDNSKQLLAFEQLVTKAKEEEIARLKQRDEEQRKAMVIDIDSVVNKFLSWKLPEHFNPDAGISFTPTKSYEGDELGNSWWPIGTNLLDFSQAKQMFIHCLSESVADETVFVGLPRDEGIDHRSDSLANAVIIQNNLYAEQQKEIESLRAKLAMQAEAISSILSAIKYTEQYSHLPDAKDEIAGAWDMAETKLMEASLATSEEVAKWEATRKAEIEAPLQAKIDALMLEYCPDEMTTEQIETWKASQRRVEV